MTHKRKPHVLVLGGNFAGLASAQKIREYAGDSVNITVIDRKDYLLFVPNVPTDVMENRDPSLHQRMQLREVFANDDIHFIQGTVKEVDVERRQVGFQPNGRPGAEHEAVSYDYLVIAMGAHLAYDRIPGFAEHGHTVSDLFHGERLRQYMHEGATKAGLLRLAQRISIRVTAQKGSPLILEAAFLMQLPLVRGQLWNWQRQCPAG